MNTKTTKRHKVTTETTTNTGGKERSVYEFVLFPQNYRKAGHDTERQVFGDSVCK